MPNLFNEIFSMENLKVAYQKSLKGDGKYKNESLRFQRNEAVNLKALRESIHNKTYRFGGYKEFTVYEPKERVINAPYYKDKIIQLALIERLNPIFEKSFIKESYACMVDKGTHAAVNQVQNNLRGAYRNYGSDAYILKGDVSKFFYSIDREILKKIYRKKIKDENVLWVMDLIVDSGGLISEKGLPLGNSLSQLCANIYLNEFDQYAKRYLQYKYFVRYADDVVVILPNKGTAKRAKTEFENFLINHLNLKANPKKTQIFPIKQGVNAYGYKIYKTHRLLRNESKKKIKRKIKSMPWLIGQGRMSINKANEMLSSWQGHAEHASSRNFMQGIANKRPFISIENGVLKINEEELNCYIEKMENTD